MCVCDIDRWCHRALRNICLPRLCARSARSTPRGRTSAPDNIGQAQSRQDSLSPTRIASESVLARECAHPAGALLRSLRPAAPARAFGLRASGDRLCLNAAWRREHRYAPSRGAWNLPMMNMACVALPAAPRRPPQASPRRWYGLTAWLLCSLRLLAARLCQNHAVTLALRCTPVAVPWDAIVSARQARALLQAAVIACCYPWDQPTNIPPRAALQSRYIFRLRQY